MLIITHHLLTLGFAQLLIVVGIIIWNIDILRTLRKSLEALEHKIEANAGNLSPDSELYSLLFDPGHRTTASHQIIVGLGSTNVPGLSAANISVQPQVVFRPERLVIPSYIASHFLVTDIKVGKNTQLVTTSAIPGIAYAEKNTFGVRLKMDTCQISMFLTISVTNQDTKPHNFQGCLIGLGIE